MSTTAPPVRAYELWYEYLKETDPDTWSEEVRKDFGGVLTKSFSEWFGNATIRFDLFAPFHHKDWYNRIPVRAALGPTDLKWITEYMTEEGPDERLMEEDQIEPPTHTVLIIDLSLPRAAIMERIERILNRKQGKRSAGRPDWKPREVRYPFACRPDVSSLEIALSAYRLRKANPGWPMWKVGNELSATFPILQKQKMKEGDIDSVNKQKVLDTVTRRYLKTAEAVMAGVVKGVFPAK